MFGSSQDRARQLAGRHRKDRKTSGSSCLSSRSVSSSTQSFTQPQLQYHVLEETLGYVLHPKLSWSKAGSTESLISQCPVATQETLGSGQHSRQVSQTTLPDTDTLPLPPNTLPMQSLLGPTKYLHHSSDLFNASATIHDISSLFKDLATHSPAVSTLHESADRFAARLRVLLVQERYQSEHMSTVIHGNPSVPNLALMSPNSSCIDSSGPYPSPRRMVSHPSPLRAPNRLAPAAEVTDSPGGSHPPGGNGTHGTNPYQNVNDQGRANTPYTSFQSNSYASNVRDARCPGIMAELTIGAAFPISTSTSVEHFTVPNRLTFTIASARLGPHHTGPRLLPLANLDDRE